MNCVINALSVGKNIEKSDIYIKNAIVSLASCEGENIEKILVSNIVKFENKYLNLFKKFNIKVIYCKFDKFYFNKDIPWQLAYYKICALDYVLNNFEYSSYLLVDTDTIFIRKLDENFWKECQNVSLLYLPYSKLYKDRRLFLEECKKYFNCNCDLNYYGGEFICGNRNNLKIYLDECNNVWKKMVDFNIYSVRGDEFIWSFAANSVKNISFANPFIERVAISFNLYYASTEYAYDDCKILHLIGEKETGLIYVYNYLLRHNSFPKLNKLRKIFGLKKAKRSLFSYTSCHLNYYLKKIIKKLKEN